MSKSKSVAAIDLGSNSFHMIVAQMDDGRLKVVDRIKEMVRLAAGLDQKNRLNNEVIERAIECLRRFGQRLTDIPPGQIRIVGTNTLRKARNSGEFIKRAEDVLSHNIDVIAGREEARLIYLGVSHSLEDDASSRLVVDIGGGSTEMILGQSFDPNIMESLHMGCVSMSRRFFSDGVVSAKQFNRAEIACLQELEPVQKTYLDLGWHTTIGASGTCVAIQNVITSEGWRTDGISASSLSKLKRELIKVGKVSDFTSRGLSAERVPVFAGGVAVLSAVFEALDISEMRIAGGALREGVIYDLVGRIQHDDVRDRAIKDLMNRYRIDMTQARRVEQTAITLLEQVDTWGLEADRAVNLLCWAARIHEIGLAIAHNQYHKHGAYLIDNMDIAGFSRGEQVRLAVVVRGHRRKFPLNEFERFSGVERRLIERLCVLLRIAVVLHRSRVNTPMPKITVKVTDNKLKLSFPSGWLDEHPLTAADLVQESEWLKPGGYRLAFR